MSKHPDSSSGLPREWKPVRRSWKNTPLWGEDALGFLLSNLQTSTNTENEAEFIRTVPSTL
jgi:hypothetical protein